jgi:dipeptidyl aminopeptidase/acylaminoacyl peptidase
VLTASAVLAAAATALPLTAQSELPTVQPAAYDQFESAGSGSLSPNGEWLAYAVNRVDERNELRVRMIAADSTIVFPFGTAAAFSGDSRWFAALLGVSPAERERLTGQDSTVHLRVAVLDLRRGTTVEVPDIAAFEFSPNGAYLALRGYPPENARASDLIIRDLALSTNVSFGNVSGFAWAPDGALLALTLDTETGVGNAVQLYDATTGTLRVLDATGSRYRGLAWRDDSRDLAVLRTAPDSAFRDTAHVAIAWTSVNTTAAARVELHPARTAGFPPGMAVSAARDPSWAADGSIISVGLRPRVAAVAGDTARPAAGDSAARRADTPDAAVNSKVSDVQVWHARDVRIMPQQKVQEQQDMRRTLLSAWHVSTDRLVRIGTDMHETARVLEGARHATETDRSRNAFGAMFGRSGVDVWLVDVSTGERTRVLDDVQQFMGGSMTGRYLLSFDDGAYWSYDTETGARTNLTAGVDAVFTDTEYDYPVDQLPPYGMAGWTRADEAVLVYDRYDVWSIAPDGSAALRLTDGRADRVIHRHAGVSPSEDGIDLARPVYFSLHGERTKQSGWARLSADGITRRLVLDDARLLRLTLADSTNVLAYTRERFDDAPAWFVGDDALRGAVQVAELNEFQNEYAWGRAELIDFTSDTGLELQAVMLHPADYDPARKYPLIVYTYEQLSQNLHNYIVPSERSYYNFNVFTAEGYFVLMPDIVYRDREPGVSALEAVVPAVRAVVERGLVDPERVGLIGHSWGGYQATFLPTRTNIFAAAVAGAPITNFLSFAGAIHWTPGIAEMSHWETGQARMGVPYWEDMEAYLRNSPAHMVHQLETPMLMMFGDADGTVDWHQGVEFYNFARRAGREDFVLLVYPGEDHGLRRRENQIDYHRRILQWFGHWLKGEPPAKWITDGMTWLERQEVLSSGR